MRVTMFVLFILGLGFTMLSTVAEARGGHYSGGHGSSHHGGSYRNSGTGNHYR